MESITYPLELKEFSWLMANHSRATNTSSNYPFIPSLTFQDEQTTKTQYLGSFLNLAFQDLALGGLSLLVLRNLYKDVNIQVSGKNFASERCNFKLLDIILTNLLKTIIGIALLAVTLPIALPVTFLFWLMSTAVIAIYAYKFGSSASKAQGMDGLWGLETTESRPFILVCLNISGKPDARHIIHHINDKILDVKDESGNYKYRKFRQTFSKLYGYYVWQDAENFCTEDHIRILDLQEYYREQITGTPIDKVSSESAEESVKVADALLNKFLSEEGITALSGNRPPWEVMLLTRGDGSYNVVIKVHHAIGDGISLMRLCVETLVDSPIALPVIPKKQNAFVRAALGIWSALLLPLGLLQLVANFDRNSMHGNQLTGEKVIATSRPIPLSILKGIKVAAGTTVNDVLMSCLSASLSKHFSRRSEKVDQVTTIVPISFHDLSAPWKLTNIFSAATVKLNVSQEYTPEERLKSTKNTLDCTKRDPTLLGVFQMLTAVSEVLPAPVAEVLLGGGGITLAASNVPGPQEEISVWGDKVKNIQFWVPNRAPVGVGFSFVSYLGYVNIGLNVDASIVESTEEAQQLLDSIEAEAYYLHKKFVQNN